MGFPYQSHNIFFYEPKKKLTFPVLILAKSFAIIVYFIVKQHSHWEDKLRYQTELVSALSLFHLSSDAEQRI